LEGVNKMYGTRIMVSQETKDLCSGIVFRFVDCIYVKGKATPTKVYEPLCLISEKTDDLLAELAEYNEAMELYNAGDWCKAKDAFAKLVKRYPRTDLYNIYFKRVGQYEVCPPPSDWDKGQHLNEK